MASYAVAPPRRGGTYYARQLGLLIDCTTGGTSAIAEEKDLAVVSHCREYDSGTPGNGSET